MKRHTDHEGRETSAGPLFELGDPICRYVHPPDVPLMDGEKTKADCIEKFGAVARDHFTAPLTGSIAVNVATRPVGTISDLEAASLRRDLGIERSARRGERVSPGWETEAVAHVRAYALKHERFLAEDVRSGFPTPEGVDGRAWGAVLKRAQSLGIVRTDGFAPANSSNRSPKVRWLSLVFEASA
jgi:hypothetical protein